VHFFQCNFNAEKYHTTAADLSDRHVQPLSMPKGNGSMNRALAVAKSGFMTIFEIPVAILFTVLLGACAPTVNGVHESQSASADESTGQHRSPGERFLPSVDAMADVTKGIKAARQSNKLALIIMGANWCHDSRALAARVSTEPLNTVIYRNYETVFVDVGYLQKGEDVITSLGPPVYYATPTVLIVDPDSGQLVNANNRHQWANADKISMKDSVAYFRQMANMNLSALGNKNESDSNLQALLADISDFEQAQADRVYDAYAVISPMLKAYAEGDKSGWSEDLWIEVRKFRYKVPGDVEALRAEARQRVAAGESDIRLDFPEYPAFSWEQKDR
jgi:hypothetical protein